MRENKKHFGIYIDKTLYDQVVEISERTNRTVNSTICILLQQAVKEKNRKKVAAKEVHT